MHAEKFSSHFQFILFRAVKRFGLMILWIAAFNTFLNTSLNNCYKLLIFFLDIPNAEHEITNAEFRSNTTFGFRIQTFTLQIP